MIEADHLVALGFGADGDPRALVERCQREGRDVGLGAVDGAAVLGRADAEPGVGLLALFDVDAGAEELRARDLYPVAPHGLRRRLTLERIDESDDGARAVLTAALPDGFALSFFDPLYFATSALYVVGDDYDFVLSGFALRLDPVAPAALADAGARRGQPAVYAPLYGMRDEAMLQAEILDVAAVAWRGQAFRRLRVPLLRGGGESAEAILYAAEGAGPPPRPGDVATAHVWLQGYLAPDEAERARGAARRRRAWLAELLGGQPS